MAGASPVYPVSFAPSLLLRAMAVWVRQVNISWVGDLHMQAVELIPVHRASPDSEVLALSNLLRRPSVFHRRHATILRHTRYYY